jgi:small GTP-binding protein
MLCGEALTRGFRVVTIGDAAVGKTSIISRLTGEGFNPNVSSTIGANFQQYESQVNNGTVILQVWDTAGHERFRALSPIYYRGAHAAVAVFAMNNRGSLESLPEQISLFLDVAQGALIYVAANKIDLEDEQLFSKKEAKEFTEKRGWNLFFTSAYSGEGIAELFKVVCEEVSKHQSESKTVPFPAQPEKSNECC